MMPPSINQLLEMVRNSEPGQEPATARAELEEAIRTLWSRIRANSSSYVMSKDEFALFNYYRSRYSSGSDAAISASATKRFWDHHRGPDGAQ